MTLGSTRKSLLVIAFFKGASVVVYKNEEIRKHQLFSYTGWPGGLFGSTTMAGTRSGMRKSLTNLQNRVSCHCIVSQFCLPIHIAKETHIGMQKKKKNKVNS